MGQDSAHDPTGRHGRRAADRLLARSARESGLWLGALALASLAMAGAELALPTVFGHAVDALLAGDAAGAWLLWCAVLVAVLVGADLLDDVAVGAATARATAWLRHTALQRLLAGGTPSTRALAPGDVATRLVGNAAEAGRMGPELVRAGATVLLGVGGALALARIDPWLCVAFLSGVPVLLLLMHAFARDASDLATRYLTVQGTIAGRLLEAIGGARTIAAAGTADREADRVLAPLPELRRHGMGMWRAVMRITAQDALIVSLLEVAVLAVGGILLARGRISAGELFAASQYVLLAASLGSVVNAVTRLARARAAAGRLGVMLDAPVVPYGSRRLPPGPGQLEFRGVTVRVDGKPVLHRLDLVVAGGQLAAVVGRSGAGKSLLAALACRLRDPDEGEVRLDGVPLPAVERAALRQEVGYGFERPVLFGDTVAAAIAFGGHVPSDEAVVAAARAARADAFIRRLPQAYATPVTQAPMSGGERQRVGLARTFAHAGRLLVLDDVAASLDTVTEHHVSRVLTESLSDRTRVVVAHRASTAARADVVIWLEGARVRAVAGHRQLWRDVDYRALFEVDEPGDPPATPALGVSG